MFPSQILYSIRKLIKQRFVFIFNLLGLSIGLAVSFLTILYIINETGYDKLHKKRDRIFRLVWDYHPKGSQSNYRILFIDEDVKFKLRTEYPEVEKIISIYRPVEEATICGKQDSFNEKDIIFTDPEITDIFTLPLIEGSKNDLLKNNFDVLITESKSKKYFNNTNPIGKILTLTTPSDTLLLTVKAVIKDFAENTTFNPGFIIKISDNYRKADNIYTEEVYLLLKPDINYTELNKKMPAFEYDYGTIMISNYFLQPFNKIYFHSDYIEYNHKKQGDIKNIFILSIIAFIILAVSLNNYIIYSVFDTRSLIKDIAIRKTLGATLRQIRNQQLINSFVFISMALLAALFITYLSIPLWNRYFVVNLYPLISSNFKFILAITGILVISSLISGLYITYYIAQINPFELFHSSFISVKFKNYFQKAVIIFQVMLFVGLSSFALIVKKQLNFALQKHPGFDKENLLMVDFSEEKLKRFYNPFTEEIKKIPFVQGVTAACYPIPNEIMGKMHVPAYKEPQRNVILDLIFVGDDFFNTMKIKMLDNLNNNFFSNKKAIIINEYAANELGIDENAQFPLTLISPDGRTVMIERICNNFDIQGIKNEKKPLAFIYRESALSYIYIRLKDKYTYTDLNNIKTVYEQVTKENQCKLKLVSDNIKDLYRSDYKLLKAIYAGTFLTILIAGIGLINVSLLILKSRTKELLIRKVNGATVYTIAKLLFKSQMKIIVIANFIVIPVSVWFMKMWLQSYALHINVGADIFIISLALSLFILLLTTLLSVKIIYRRSVVSALNRE